MNTSLSQKSVVKISIVIPTKNAGPDFEKTLSALSRQKVDAATELLVIDSGSQDETLPIAERFGARILKVDPGSFNHGETRNEAIRNATGDFVALTVQDAVPCDENWLQRLLVWLQKDSKIAGVFGKSVPRADADLLAQWEVEAHNRIFDKGPRVKSLASWDEFLSRDFMGRFDLALFDNVCSALRKSAWERIPFKPAEFGEDLEWCLDVMRSGEKIVHEPSAAVFHSHNRPAIYRLKRHFVTTKRVMQVLASDVEDYSRYTDETLLSDLMAFAFQVEELMARVSAEGPAICLEVGDLESEVLNSKNRESAIQQGARNTVERVSALLARLRGNRQVLPPTVPVGQDPLRASFNYTMRQLVARYPKLSADEARFLLINVAARAAGDVLSKYYYWRQKNHRLSETMEMLGASLSQGI